MTYPIASQVRMESFLCKWDHPFSEQTQFSIWLNNSSHNNVVANKFVKLLPIDLRWYKYGRNTLNTVVGICNLPFEKLIFSFAVSHISRIVEKTKSYVHSTIVIGSAAKRHKEVFIVTHLQADYFYFQLQNFPQFTANWLVLVPWIENAILEIVEF